MRIAIIGDGKMGQAVAVLARERGHTVTAMLSLADNPGGSGISADRLGHPEAAVEFTEPSSAAANALSCLRAGIPVVVGTTGWYEQLAAVSAEARRVNGALFWAPNFSVGVAVLGVAIEAALKAARRLGGIDAHLVETHHAAKKDRPSGTAAALAEIARSALGTEVPITSVRVGHVPGTHELILDGPFDQVRLVHEARDRRLFAEGALTAAEWLPGRYGVFTMKDLLDRQEAAQ